MFKKEIPSIFIGLSVVVAVLVLGWVVFIKSEVPVQTPVVDDGNVPPVIEDNDNSEIDTSDWKNDDDDPNQKVYRMVDISKKLLFIENSSVYPRKAPYGTLPDNIYILDILKSNKSIVSIETNILPEERASYKLLGDRIYFFSKKDKMVEWMDFEGNMHKLVFTEVDDWTYSNYFLISPDSQKIVWVETSGWDESGKLNSKLILADLDGQNKKILIEKSFGFKEKKYFQPIRWSNSSEEIYFTEQRGGLGGYIIFDGPANLSKINIYTDEIEHLFDENGYIGDISPNEEFISYFAGGDNPKLVIKSLRTETENVFDIPIKEGFKGGGKAHFSPDSKHLAYNIAHWDPDNEYYRTVVISFVGKEQRTIVDFQKAYEVVGWASNDKILLCDFSGNTFIINIDGTDLKKIEIEE